MVNIIELFKKLTMRWSRTVTIAFASMAHRKPGYATIAFSQFTLRLIIFESVLFIELYKKKNQSDEVIIERLKSITLDWKSKKIKNHTHVHLIHQRRFYQFKLTSPSGELLNHTFTVKLFKTYSTFRMKLKVKSVVPGNPGRQRNESARSANSIRTGIIFLLPRWRHPGSLG